jgi:hypothetical protein
MQCPKCGTPQTGTDLCGSCGIYFTKYELYLEKDSLVQGYLKSENRVLQQTNTSTCAVDNYRH